MTALFFLCVFFLQSILYPVIVQAKCAKFYTLSATPVAPAPSTMGAPTYGTCASVFPNATGAVMPSVGDPNPQLQNMAQVSCGQPGQQGLSFWVATVNNSCATPACFTSDGVACTPGTDGCPCNVVTACTPRVFTAPLDCLLCPPTPCVVCPPPPPPAAVRAANMTTTPPAPVAAAPAAAPTAAPTAAPVANATVAAAPTAAPVAAALLSSPPPPPPPPPPPVVAAGRRSLHIFGGGSSSSRSPSRTSSRTSYSTTYSTPAPSTYSPHRARSTYRPSTSYRQPVASSGAAAAPQGPSNECVSADCLQCRASFAWLHTLGGVVCFAFLLYAGYNRSKMHSQYGIRKDGCIEDSYLPWLICWPCALCQEARTIDDMERDKQLVHGMHNPLHQPLLPKMA
jgi:Cys-rich protein (TIGR01571 family)